MAKGGFRGPMGGGMNMNMIKQAQKMQQDMLKMQQELEEMKKTEETAGIGEITEEETTAVVGETETAGTTGTEDTAVVPEEIITEEYGIDKTKQGSEADTEGHQ